MKNSEKKKYKMLVNPDKVSDLTFEMSENTVEFAVLSENETDLLELNKKYQKYADAGLSMSEIAKKEKVSKSQVFNVLSLSKIKDLENFKSSPDFTFNKMIELSKIKDEDLKSKIVSNIKDYTPQKIRQIRQDEALGISNILDPIEEKIKLFNLKNKKIFIEYKNGKIEIKSDKYTLNHIVSALPDIL